MPITTKAPITMQYATFVAFALSLLAPFAMPRAAAQTAVPVISRNTANAEVSDARRDLHGSSATDVRDYGARCDVVAKQYDGAISAGSNQFTSRAVTFDSADVGKYIVIGGAGAAGAPLATKITAVNGHTATLATNAATTIPSRMIAGAKLVSRATVQASYAPGETITIAGGTGAPAVLKVGTTQVASARVHDGGSGYVDGVRILTLTTGTGSAAKASVKVSGGAVVSVASVFLPGAYTVNPTLVRSPTSAAAGSGATFDIIMAPLFTTVSDAGNYRVLPALNRAAQASTNGSGNGATWILVQTNAPFWYYGSDDSAAFSSALVPASSGKVHVPGANCGIASPISIPAASSPAGRLVLFGEGIDKSTIYALAPMAQMMTITNGFAFGGGIYDLTFDAFKLATNGVLINAGPQLRIDEVSSRNAVDSEWVGGDGAHFFGSNYLNHIRGYSDDTTFPPALRSLNNIDVRSMTDSVVANSTFYNASNANIRMVAGVNHWDHNHTYGFPHAQFATYGIEIAGGGQIITGHQFDGALSKQMYIKAGTGTVAIIGSELQWSLGYAGSQGIVIASGQKNVVVMGNVANRNSVNATIDPAQVIVQEGTADPSTVVLGNAGASYSSPGTPR